MPSAAAPPASPFPLPAAPLGDDPFRTLHHQFSRFASGIFSNLNSLSHSIFGNVSKTSCLSLPGPLPPLFASTSQPQSTREWGKHVFDVALGTSHIARTLRGTSVYTVSNSKNEFVLITDPNNGAKSLGLLCFREEDAKALLAQVKLKEPVLGKGAKVAPITLDQVYMLKVEGISFRFLPDPLQIRNAVKLKSDDTSSSFDGVPIFQSDQLVVKKKNKRYYPLYFRKEDVEEELDLISRRGAKVSQNISVGSLEDVLRKMEKNVADSGWDDLVFIPPGMSYSDHIGTARA